MKPNGIKFPQIKKSRSKQKMDNQVDSIRSLHQQIKSIQNNVLQSNSQSLRYQAQQTQLLRQILTSINKSVKLQSAMYRVSKQLPHHVNLVEEKSQKQVQPETSSHIQDKYFSNSVPQKTQSQDEQNNTEKDKVTQTVKQYKKVLVQKQKPPALSQQNQLQKTKKNNQYKCRPLLLPFQISSQQVNIYKSMSVWIGNLYQSLAYSAFYGFYSTKQMNKQQTKLYFSKNLISNYLKLIQYLKKINPPFWKQNKNNLLAYFGRQSRKAVSFLKLKFPQKKKIYVNPQLSKLIPSFDSIEQYDGFILENLDFEFQEKDLWACLKKFLNNIIDNSKSLKEVFVQAMSKMFTIQSENKETHIIKHIIDTKLPNNTPKYTKQEIHQDGLDIKTPQILRVILKWIQSYESIIDTIHMKPMSWYKIDEDNISLDFNFQEHRIQQIGFFATQKVKTIERVELQQNQLINGSIDIIKLSEKCREQFKSIPQNSFETGVFTSLMAESLTLLAGDCLHFMLTLLGSNLDKGRGLIFEVYDLFRARCEGSMEQIKAVYNNIDKCENITVIRVKNRTATSNRDFLINFIIQNITKNEQGHMQKKSIPFICELQLVVVEGQSQQKQHYYNQFNHFLYQLQRSRYGPICQAVSIIANTDDSISYFQSNKINQCFKVHTCKTAQTSIKQDDYGTQIFYNGNQCTEQQFNFVCSCCSKYVKSHSDMIPVSINEATNKKVCGNCVEKNMSPQMLAELLLTNTDQQLFLSKYFETTRFGPIFLHSYKYFIKIKKCLPKTITPYKSLNQKWVQCMFEFKDQEPSDDVIFDQKEKLKFNFYFGLKKDAKTINVNFAKIKKLFDQNLVRCYQDILPNIEQISDIVEKIQDDQKQLRQCTFTLLLLQPSNNYLLLDAFTKNLDHNVYLLGQKQAAKNQLKNLENSRSNKWVLKGDYTEFIFKYLQSIKQYPQTIDCELPLIKTLPELYYPKLKKIKLVLNEAVLDMNQLVRCNKIQTIQIVLEKGQCSFKNCAFPNLQFLLFKSVAAESLDFTGMIVPKIYQFEINCKSLNSFLGFQLKQQLNETPVIKIKDINISLGKIDIDLRSLDTSETVDFQLHNQGQTLMPNFGEIRYLVIDSPYFDFNSLNNSTVACLELIGVHNINDINYVLNDLNKIQKPFSIQISQTKAKQLIFKNSVRLSDLTLRNSLIQQLVFDAPIQLSLLQIQHTKIRTINLANVNIKSESDSNTCLKLTDLDCTGNNLTEIIFRDIAQVSKLSSLNVGYNYYSEDFLKPFPFSKDVWKKLTNVDIGRYSNNPKIFPNKDQQFRKILKYQLLKLTDTQFRQFILDIQDSNHQQDISGLTQEQILLQKDPLKGFKIQKYDYGDMESIKKINESYNSLRQNLQLLKFKHLGVNNLEQQGKYSK